MSEHSLHPDERIARVAARQHGLITHRQLRRLGVSEGAIRTRRESGHLRRVHTGVYAVGHDTLTAEGRRLAAAMACGPEALLSHAHASATWGMLPPWDQPSMAAIDVTVPADCGRGRRRGIIVHRANIATADRRVQLGIPVTAPGARSSTWRACSTTARSNARSIRRSRTR